MKRIRGGRGLGDAIYLRPIGEHFLRAGEPVTMLSDYPGVFAGMDVALEPFNRNRVDVLAHYVLGKANPDTNQWQDVCKSAGVDVPLSFKWDVINPGLLTKLQIKADGRPIILVHGGRVPMGRADGFGMELLPERAAFESALEGMNDALLVRVGKEPPLYPLPCEVDLNGSATVTDLLDIASVCDGVIGQCSFAIPLAEVFDKPLLVVWAAQGLKSREPYIAQITPKKVLSKATSKFVMDDWPAARIREEAHAFRHA